MLHLKSFPTSHVEFGMAGFYLYLQSLYEITFVSGKAPIQELYGPLNLFFPNRQKHAFTVLNAI
jgi:hypothetical protein